MELGQDTELLGRELTVMPAFTRTGNQKVLRHACTGAS